MGAEAYGNVVPLLASLS